MKLRSGVCYQLEEAADELIRKSLSQVTSRGEKSDILTPWKEANRRSLEVYVSEGMPDSRIRQGIFKREINAGKPYLNCLAPETEVLTREFGSMPIAELNGTTQEVLTSEGWGKADFDSFGEQDLYPIELSNGRSVKTVWATAAHRWFVWEKIPGVYRSGDRVGLPKPVVHQSTEKTEMLTSEMQVGQKLVSKTPPLLIARTTPSSIGVAHGFTYGDGSLVTRKRGINAGAYVDLLGAKMVMQEFFPKPRLAHHPRPNVSVETVQIQGLPGYFKELPSFTESVPYLYGFLSGWFAADGSVDEQGHCLLSAHKESDIRFAANICHRLGVLVAEPRRSVSPSTFTGESHETWCLSIDKWSLTESFFQIPHHRLRWINSMAAKKRGERPDWSVKNVGAPDRHETVYCAVVPSTEDFVISGYILTGNSTMGAVRGSRAMGEHDEEDR
jgi:DNA primase